MRQHLSARILLSCLLVVPLALGCADDDRKKKHGDFCSSDTNCESGICYDNVCLDPDGDLDGDGLKNGVEKNLLGTDLGDPDSDGDGVPDGEEAGDINAPEDRDGDGVLDALESRLAIADADGDCISDEYDPENDVYTNDMAMLVELHCALPGVCETGRDAVIATCSEGVPQCDFSKVPDWEADETLCDGLDNDCDEDIDRDLNTAGAPACLSDGVCGASGAAPVAVCANGDWTCDYTNVPDHEADETLCDELDNDCDGVTDEDLVGGDCDIENEFGTCTGTWACDLETGGRVCEGTSPEAEVCDELDNNCDGETDEDLAGVACDVANKFGTCEGTTVCDLTRKEAVCDAPTPAFDECDGMDNDCNGATDENGICDKTARIIGRIIGMPPPASTAGFKAATTGDPVAGARIVALYGEECGLTEVPETAVDFTFSFADGTFILPLTPGYWCLFVEADGWESMKSWEVMLEENEAFPVEFVLGPTGTLDPPLSVCGRTVVYEQGPSVAAQTSMFTPVGEVDVALRQGDTLLGTTTSNADGYFCITGIQGLDIEQEYLMLTGAREGYYPGNTELPIQGGILFITYLFMEPEPTEFTACLMDDFESGGTDVQLAAVGGYWEPSEHLGGVGWNQTWSWATPNAFLSDNACVRLPADEDCTPGTEGCAICDGQNPTPGCLLEPGYVPQTWSGEQGWYFGNLEYGAYLPFETKCSETGPILGGSLASPWFDTWRVVEMHLDFKSAWEVESFNPQADMLLVETQNSLMSETDSWTLVGALKPEDVVSSEDATMPWSSGGIDRAPVWLSYHFDMTPFAGDMMRIRFRFDSVDGDRNAFRGWLIDDVAITGRGCNEYMIPVSR
jgi:hypothetical protein